MLSAPARDRQSAGQVVPRVQSTISPRQTSRPTHRTDTRVFTPILCRYAQPHERSPVLGKLPRAVVRPPLVKIERAEIARIRQALIDAGLLDKNAARDAA